MQKKLLLTILLISNPTRLLSYNLPPINLGSTNILDGGPLRPKPGHYLYEFLTYYYSNKFLDAEGKNLGGVKSPTLQVLANTIYYVYQLESLKVLGASPGIALIFPCVLYSTITPNSLGLKNAGAGFSNIFINPYIQWEPIKYKGREIFVHRLAFDLALPVGTNKFPEKNINPASIMTYIDPYWAATWYVTERLAVSWRVRYLWMSTNRKTLIKPGQTFHVNFSAEGKISKDCWIAINGYFLQQLFNDRKCGEWIPNSKERVLGLGPGFAWLLPKEFTLLGHLYFETLVQNKTKGTRAILRFIKHF